MRHVKVGLVLAATAVAVAGCGSFAGSAPEVSQGATINGCVIQPNTDCSGKRLVAADLHGADLSGANFTGADLSYANLNGANLTNANFTRARAWYTNMQSANLTGANMENSSFANLNVIHAVCPNGVMARNSRCDWPLAPIGSTLVDAEASNGDGLAIVDDIAELNTLVNQGVSLPGNKEKIVAQIGQLQTDVNKLDGAPDNKAQISQALNQVISRLQSQPATGAAQASQKEILQQLTALQQKINSLK